MIIFDTVKEQVPSLSREEFNKIINILIRDGAISYTYSYHQEVYDDFKKYLELYGDDTQGRVQARDRVCKERGFSKVTLWRIVKRFN
jgi:hypothetical protein